MVSTLTDLGVPGLVGVVVGAVLSLLVGLRLLDRQVDRQKELLAEQRGIDAAGATDAALHRLVNALSENSGPQPDWAIVDRQFKTDVEGAAYLLQDEDLATRVDSVGIAIWVAAQHPDEALWFTVNESVRDARAGLRAAVAGKPLPARNYPTRQETMALLWEGQDGTPNVLAYKERVVGQSLG